MHSTRWSAWNPGGRNWLLPASAALGVGCGLFVYGYSLTGILPGESRALLAALIIAAALAAVAYRRLLAWVASNLDQCNGPQRFSLALLSIPVSAFLFYAGTSSWRDSSRYLTILLPSHRLQLSILPPSTATGTALVWFNTSLGDISYDTIELHGWKRQGDELVLQNPEANGLTWVGKTGDQVQLVFRTASPNVKAHIVWDDEDETVTLSAGRPAYSHGLAVPFYASGSFIMLLGLLNFYILSLAGCLVLWVNRSKLAGAAHRAMSSTARGFGGVDAALLVGAVAAALLLRVFNLGNVFPAIDEYYHLIAAKQILEGAAFNSVYQRSLWTVTVPVSVALRLFGNQLWAARVVGAVLNGLAVVPLYLMLRKMNRPVATIACALFATSPWVITFARVAREYAYYPFYFYWIIYAMVLFTTGIPAGFVFASQWRVLLRPNMLLLLAALSIPPVFALSVDSLSTFRTILIAYLVFGCFVLLRFNWREKRNLPVLALVAVGLAASGRAWYQEQGDKMLVLPQLNALPIEYFFPNPQQQWYFDRAVIIMAAGLLGALAFSFMAWRVNFIPLFAMGLFGSYLAVFVLFSKTFFHTRHLLSTDLWYIVVAAIGLYALWGALCTLLPGKRPEAGLILAAVLGLLVLNPQQIVLPSVSTNPDMPISEDYLHDLTQVQAFMLANARPDDALISTVYGLYATWEGTPAFEVRYRITTHTPKKEILGIVDQYSSGWIVIDQIRLDLSSLAPRDFAGVEGMKYVGLFGDQNVWHWQHPTEQGHANEFYGRDP